MAGSAIAPRGRTALAILVGAGALAVACSSTAPSDGANGSAGGAREGAEASASTALPRVRPPVDLAPVIRSTALRYRADGATFTASAPTFASRITGTRVEITPRRDEQREASTGPTLALDTSLVARGSRVLATAGNGTRALEADGAVTIRRGDVTERIENDEAGVEQSWRFERAPSGDGDLVVRVRATGARYATSSTHGLHFGVGGGVASLGLRYGTATWVDAQGARTVVVPRMAGDEIVMVVPSDVVARSAYPAVLDPTVTAESEVDTPVAGSSASGEQYSPSIASIGTGKGYLAVWYDRRGVRPALYGARIASDGTVLDDTGILIASGVGSTQPQVAASPNGFLVTWAVSYVDLYQSPGVYAVRLDAQGAPLDSAPLTLAANQTNVQLPTSAFDGTSWLVAWQRYGGGPTSYDITGIMVPGAGPLTNTTLIDISKAPDAEFNPVVRFDGTNHFVVWRSYNALYARKIGKDGKPVTDRLTVVTANNASLYNFQTAFDGNQHLLVWNDYGNSSYDVYARRVNLAGAPIDPGNVPIVNDTNYDERPRAVFDGSTFVVTWSRSGQLMASRFGVGGGVLDATPIPIATGGDYYEYGLASDGTGTIAVNRMYATTTLAGSDVRGVSVGKPPASGATPFLVSKAANSETEPSSAWNGSTHMTVWLDTRDGRPSLYGATVGADGKASAPQKIVSETRFATELTRPRVASDGAGFFVVFYAYESTTGKRGIFGLRLDATGKPDASGIFEVFVPPTTSDFAREPDVAFDGANYLVVWEHQSNEGGSTTSIQGLRFPKTGTTAVDKEPLRLTTANPVEQRLAPSVAFDGQSYFVAWITSRATAAGGIQVSHVYGTRVSKEGAALDGEQVICNAFLLQRAPDVAGDTKLGGFMVVWEDYRNALESADVYGARISPQGVNLDGVSGMKIAAGTHDESRPRVAPSGDGTNWVVAWRDLRSKQTYDLYGAWVSRAGKVFDPNGLVLSAEGGDEDAPWLSASNDGRLLLTYQRLDPRTGYGSYRVRARAIAAGAPVASACTKGDDCASRSCVDGVCCSTECGACGVCNATPGTCTPRPAGAESPTCPGYKCKGTLECPSKCETDADCASNATCDPSSKTCVSRVICIDDKTLKDISGKTTDCAPFKCVADACKAACGSVDDCAAGFVCDYGGRCILPPAANDGGCATTGGAGAGAGGAGSGVPTGAVAGGLATAWALATALRRRKRGADDQSSSRSTRI